MSNKNDLAPSLAEQVSVPNAELDSQQLAFMLERTYELGRRHRHREDELVRHNNAQLEENRQQRRVIRQQEGALRRISAMLAQAQREVDDENRDSLIQAAAEFAGNAPDGEAYRYQDQVEVFAENTLRAMLPDADEVQIRSEMVPLTEAISVFLRDDIGI